MGECSNHTALSCETFARVYINHTSIKKQKKTTIQQSMALNSETLATALQTVGLKLTKAKYPFRITLKEYH